MSDNDSGGLSNGLATKRGCATLDDLTLIVRPPGRRADIQTFTVLVDLYGPRFPAIPMMLGFGVGLMLMAALPNNQVVFYLLCIVIGACAGALNPVAHATVVSDWFADRRGFALGVLMSGMGAYGSANPVPRELRHRRVCRGTACSCTSSLWFFTSLLRKLL